MVVVLMGLPGAGKTPVARRLADALGARMISRDAIRAAMFDPPHYTDEEKQAAFEALLAALDVTLTAGMPAVLDGLPFARPEQLEAVQAIAARRGKRVVTVLLDVPVAVARARVAADVDRGRPAADRSPEDVSAIAARFAAPPAGTLVVDAAQEPGAVASAVLARLEAA
jgi:predicted kinase